MSSKKHRKSSVSKDAGLGLKPRGGAVSVPPAEPVRRPHRGEGTRGETGPPVIYRFFKPTGKLTAVPEILDRLPTNAEISAEAGEKGLDLVIVNLGPIQRWCRAPKTGFHGYGSPVFYMPQTIKLIFCLLQNDNELISESDLADQLGKWSVDTRRTRSSYINRMLALANKSEAKPGKPTRGCVLRWKNGYLYRSALREVSLLLYVATSEDILYSTHNPRSSEK